MVLKLILPLSFFFGGGMIFSPFFTKKISILIVVFYIEFEKIRSNRGDEKDE